MTESRERKRQRATAQEEVSGTASAHNSHPLIEPNWVSSAHCQRVLMDSIVIDPKINPRFERSEKTVKNLVKALKAGATVPPIVVFETEQGLLLADGVHRHEAHRRHGSKKLYVELHRGSAEDAERFAVFINRRHGKRLKAKEVRAAIKKWLDDEDFHRRSDAEIAELCGCSPPTVAKVRKDHPLTEKLSSHKTRMVRRDGTHIEMDVGNIGGKPQRASSDHVDSEIGGERGPKAQKVKVSPEPPSDKAIFEAVLISFDTVMKRWDDPNRLAFKIVKFKDKELQDRFERCFKWFELVHSHYAAARKKAKRKTKK